MFIHYKAPFTQIPVHSNNVWHFTGSNGRQSKQLTPPRKLLPARPFNRAYSNMHATCYAAVHQDALAVILLDHIATIICK